MIRFEKLRWKNLLSTGQYFTELDLTRTDTTLVCGENGAGKSTMLDALCFVLFGKPYRNINLPQLVNSINQRESVVEIEFSIGKDAYKVIRGQAPKLFEVHKNGKMIDQEAKSKDYQRMFEEQILRMNYKSFCQVVILGSANYVPFMRLVAAERRAIVETILDINIFSTMNTMLKGKVSQNREEMVELEGKIAVIKERLSLQRKFLDEKTKDEKDLVEKYEAEIKEAEDRIEAIKKEMTGHQEHLTEYLEKIDDKPLIEGNKTKLDSLQKQLTSKVKSLNNSIEFYEKNDTCPTCTQSIGAEFKDSAKASLESKRKEVDGALGEIGKQMEKVMSRMEELRETILAMKEIEAEINDCKNELSMQNKFIEKTRAKLEDAKKPKSDDTKDKEDLAKTLAQETELVEGRNELVDTQYYYGVASTLLKDSGIKSRIIKHYIPVINRTINKYLSMMNFFVNFHLDDEFNETIKSRHRDIFTYASFSEGEKRKIDLALLFAWRAMAEIKNSLSTNLLILDEVLDGSLDDTSTEAFLEIVNGMRGQGVNVFVISHKSKEVLQDKFERHVQMSKVGNFSKMN